MNDWRQQLAELLAGPYAGSGGAVALAEALGVNPHTLKHWRRQPVPRCAPRWVHRQAIALLWRSTVEAERQVREREEVKEL